MGLLKDKINEWIGNWIRKNPQDAMDFTKDYMKVVDSLQPAAEVVIDAYPLMGEETKEAVKDNWVQTNKDPVEAANNFRNAVREDALNEAKEIIANVPGYEIKQDNGEQALTTNINGMDIFEYIDKVQKEQWAREDEIRAETQAREDSAYQRAAEDMRKAGIDPNLIGISAAQSGGGITTATGKNYTVYQEEMNKYLEMLEAELDREFKEDENKKDRWSSLIENSLRLALMVAMMA